ncbi:hypothetical protein [Halomicrobium urmianum]|uniref:hypothetical protein n=1 Tax=Halomicrobium urmianum TaxID=1586233 RepID=UPI001CD99716|nr:hypothetical protein [Halomicrobium urmianum]
MVSEAVAIPAVIATLGAVGLYTGWKRRRVYAAMADLDPTPIRETASPGTIEIEGTARPGDGPVEAPVTGREAVAAAWTVEEWDERGDTSHWREVARGVEIAPLAVEDETGAIDVDPVSKSDAAGKWTQTTGVTASDGVRMDDVLLEFETFDVQVELAPDEAVPDRIADLHAEHGLYEDTGSITNAVDVGRKHGRRRYKEAIVAPGDDAYVLGRAEDASDPDRERLRSEDAHVTEPDDGLMIVSDQGEGSIESEYRAGSQLRFAGGAVALVLGTLGTLWMLGLV